MDKDFIQILQTALLFTDDDMNILSIKKLDCRNSSWDLPSPGAMLTTGFTPDNLKSSKNSNFEMMCQVDGWLRGQHWPITFIGYNSIEYDEPVLAQNLYQNLLPPGLTTSRNPLNGQLNGRIDILHLVQTVALYMPGVLKLEILNNVGTPSLTLGNVARQNGVLLSDTDAHDALNDVKATADIAKVLKKAAPHIWEQALKLSTVEGVDAFLSKNDIFTFSRFMYGRTEKSSVMTSVAARKDGTTQALFDLRFDPTPYLGLSAVQLKAVLQTKGKGNPFVMMRKEAQPTLMTMEHSAAILTEQDDVALFKKRAKMIKADPAFLENVVKAAHMLKQEQWAEEMKVPPKMPESMINKKVSPAARTKLDAWAKEFREAANWHERAKLAKGFQEHFSAELAADPTLSRFEKLAERLVFEHAPQELAAARQLAMKNFIANRILNPDLKAPYMTIAKARKELEKIEKLRLDPKSDKWKEVTDSEIRKLKLYYTAQEKMFTPFATHYNFNKVANNDTPTPPAVKRPPAANDGPKI